MKRKTWIILLFLFCIGGAAVFLSSSVPAQSCFVGSRITADGVYRLDIDRMTGTDWFTMELSAGDMLAVQFETVEGSIYLEIREPDETVLYAGNGEGVTEFTLNLSESGAYSIYVEACRAKGTVFIQQAEEKEAKSGA